MQKKKVVLAVLLIILFVLAGCILSFLVFEYAGYHEVSSRYVDRVVGSFTKYQTEIKSMSVEISYPRNWKLTQTTEDKSTKSLKINIRGPGGRTETVEAKLLLNVQEDAIDISAVDVVSLLEAKGNQIGGVKERSIGGYSGVQVDYQSQEASSGQRMPHLPSFTEWAIEHNPLNEKHIIPRIYQTTVQHRAWYGIIGNKTVILEFSAVPEDFDRYEFVYETCLKSIRVTN